VARAHTDTGPRLTPPTPAAKSRLPLIAGVAVVVLALVAGGIFVGLKGRSDKAASAPPSTLSAKVAAALAKGRELEARLAALEAEKEAAQAAAAEQARQELEAQAKASGVAVDLEAVARAQEAARRKAEAEQAKRFEEERQRLVEERRRVEEERLAEEARLAEEQRKAEEARVAEERRQAEEARLAREARLAATPVPTAPPPTPPPPVRKGTLVDVTDSGVVPPAVEKSPRLRYPRAALRRQVEGVVELSALIDENGNVVEVEVVKPAGGDAGLTEAAVDNVRKRKYRPARQNGVPVKVRLPVSVRFKLLAD